MSALYRLILLSVLVGECSYQAFAQDEAPEENSQPAEPAEQQRIVDGRPFLYSAKRAAHPLTWVEVGMKPVFRLTQNERLQALLARKPGKIRLGFGGAGSGSGFGPLVTFVDENVLGRGIKIEMPLLYTYRSYESYQLNASVPVGSPFSLDGVSFDIGTGYSSRAADDFFGLGNQSPGEEETAFRTVTRRVSAGFTAKPAEGWTAQLTTEYRRVGVTKPHIGESMQDRFASAGVPGLFSGATLGSAGFGVTHDTITRDEHAFRGGRDEFRVSFNDSVDGNDFRYWRYRFKSEHFFWLNDDGRKVVAARALFESNQGRVPFFDMPYLGTTETLRGFHNFRFRDNNAAALTLEYRYRIWRKIDWGLFVDEGQVAPRLADMALGQFHTGYGVRLFVWPKPNSPISFDYGRSNETWRLYINLNTRF